jgi:hypothetical protein
MRTTLEIDDDVLSAAKELAEARQSTAGRVISDLARQALTAPAGPAATEARPGLILKDGWYLLPGRAGAIVTKELVDRLADEADPTEVGRAKGRD